jgi:hypothetical protein
MRDYMRGHVAAVLVQFARHGHVGNLRRLLLSMPHHYALLLARAVFHRRFSGRVRLLGTEVRGALAGLGAARWAASSDREALPRETGP